MTESEFAEILARGYELRNVEHKGPGHREQKPYLSRVARAVLGMANLRDDGLVTLGVGDDGGRPSAVGLDTEQLAGWGRYEHVAAALDEFAQPSVRDRFRRTADRGGRARMRLARRDAPAQVETLAAAQTSPRIPACMRGLTVLLLISPRLIVWR